MWRWLKFGGVKRLLVSAVAACALVVPLAAAPMAAAAQGPDGSVTAATTASIRPGDVAQLSQRVRELIRIVEASQLSCEIRNALVDRLRVLDDALLSGRLTGARALATAWRLWANNLAGTRLLGASTNTAVQERLAAVREAVGWGWPANPKPTRSWPKLPECGKTGPQAVATTGSDTWDSGKTLTALSTALQMIPSPLGNLFAGMLTLMWPTSTAPDVTTIVDKAVLDYALAQAGNVLDQVKSQYNQWFYPALNAWLTECGKTDSSPPDWQPPAGCGPNSRAYVASQWGSYLGDLVAAATAMQVNSAGHDYRGELLPLYVQVENLLIAHLQLGVVNRTQWWPDSPELQAVPVNTLFMHIETQPGDPPAVGKPVDPTVPDVTGVGYVENVYQLETTNNSASDFPVDTNSSGLNIAQWKARNAWARDHGTIESLYFSDLWPFMDPIKYPNGDPSYKQTRIIYTDPVGCESGSDNPSISWHRYADRDPGPNVDPLGPNTNVSSPLSLLEVWEDLGVDYLDKVPVIDAARFTGTDGVPSPLMGDTATQGTRHAWQLGLSSDDPNLMPSTGVTVAEGYRSYNSGPGLWWPQGLYFYFPDGGTAAAGSDWPTDFADKNGGPSHIAYHNFSYAGQVVANIKILDTHQWEDIWGNVQDKSADCVLVGFRFADSF